MMTSITKEFLSGSTNGRNIQVAITGTLATMTLPGELIHTATASANVKDEIWLWATNVSGTTVSLGLQWGGTSNPRDIIAVGIPASQGEVLVIPGLPLNNGLSVRAFATTTSGININGYVNRIDENA